MKKLLVIGIVAAGMSSVAAQQKFALTEGQPTLVYSLPAIELVVDVEIEKTVEKPGVFYQYSQRYLATNKVVTEEAVNYQLRSVQLSTRPVTVLQRKFSVLPGAVRGLVVDKNGFLAGVNVPLNQPLPVPVKRSERKPEMIPPRPEGMLPLNQEYMMAGSTAKMAEGAAYQIYALRESRINLLTGEMDHLPADGESLRQMLQGIDRQERELTELFTGAVRKEIIRERITLIPDTSETEKVLFRISTQRGFVDNDDLGGEPYYIVMDSEPIVVSAPVDTKSKPKVPVLYTALPTEVTVEISDGVKTLLKKQLDIPQFGVLIPYDAAIFKSKNLQMEVDVVTGRLLKLQH